MQHLGTKEICTDRLTLRRFVQEDVLAAFNNWCSDDRVTKYLMWPTHTDVSVTENVLDSWIKLYEKADFYQWAIVLNEIAQPIGSISVVKIDENVDSVHVGYCIGYNWWNKGIVSEAFAAIIKFFFEEMQVRRVESRHDPNNPNSGKVMLKCGLKYEGTLRQSDHNNQGIVDCAYYGLLSSEYIYQSTIQGLI